MAGTASASKITDAGSSAWQGFRKGLWQAEINVRDFIQQNYEPYDGDASFLAGPTERTNGIWKKLTKLFVEERKKGVLDVSQIPSSIPTRTPPMPRGSRVPAARCRLGSSRPTKN